MSAIKDKVDSVITTYGSDITIRTYTITGNDKWGKVTSSSYADRSIKAVKDNYLKTTSLIGSQGRISDSQSGLIVQADEVFDVKADKVIFGGIIYNITEVQPLEITNEVLAQILQVGKD